MLTTSTGANQTWAAVGFQTECDTSAGEVFQQSSSGKVSSLEACKQSCLDAAGCKSITFYDKAWCNHYSTSCTKAKTRNKAIALRLGTVTTTANNNNGKTITTTGTATTTPAPGFWEIVSGGTYCHIVDGGRCVWDGDGSYGRNENCSVKAL